MSPLGDVPPCQVCGSYHFNDVYGQMPYCPPQQPYSADWWMKFTDDYGYVGKHVKEEG